MLRKLISLISVAGAAACGSGGPGHVKVYLTDAPLEGATAVNVTFEAVTLVTSDGLVEIMGEPRTVNLLELRNGARTLLGESDAEAINQIRLKIDGTATVVLADGTAVEAKVPSGAQTGIKIAGRIDPSAEGEILLDFDAEKSIVQAGDKLILKPVIRIVMASHPRGEDGDGERPDEGAGAEAEAHVGAGGAGAEASAEVSAEVAATPATPAEPPAEPPPESPPEDAAEPAEPATPAEPGDDEGTECQAEASADAQVGLDEAASASGDASLSVECAVR